jgi:hypothetical protein
MPALHKSKLLYNLKQGFFLFSILIFLVLAGTAVTLPGHSRASDGPALPRSGSTTVKSNPIPTPTSLPCPELPDPIDLENPINRRVIGEFSPVIHLPLVPVHLSVLPDGRVLFWGRDRAPLSPDPSWVAEDASGRSEAYVWDVPGPSDNPKANEGSNKTDVAVFRPSEGNWWIINSLTGTARITHFGVNGDVPVPGDYDGDGRADLAVFHPSDGNWHINKSSDGMSLVIACGQSTDRVAPGDYDGDGKTDAAVFRPSDGTWHIRYKPDGPIEIRTLGSNEDIPVPKDYDADRKTDIAVFQPAIGNWVIRYSSHGLLGTISLGFSGDVPVPGDYNGDGRADAAVFRPSDGIWRIRNVINPALSKEISFGCLPTDIAAPGDYDGDGKTDAAVFRPSEGKWLIHYSSDETTQEKTWGLNGDLIAPADYDGMLRVANTTTNLFCSGHSFLPDGRLFVAGGHQHPKVDGSGERQTNIFDYRTNSWSSGRVMEHGRWYPYNVTLGTGEPLIMSGIYWTNTDISAPTFAANLVPQVYTPGPGGGSLRNLKPASSLTFYPYIHLTPDGKVFQTQSGFLDFRTPSTLDKASRLLNTDPKPGTEEWLPLGEGNTILPHALGTSVLFDSGRKALIVGGYDTTQTPTKEAEFIELKPYLELNPGQDQPTWTEVASMAFARAYHTATVLPNGKVLVTGGVSCPGGNHIKSPAAENRPACNDGQVLVPEMWDPLAEKPPDVNGNPDWSKIPWCKMAAHKEVRAYHSLAALLPDGRVLVGGGGLSGAVGEKDANDIEITNNNANLIVGKIFGHKNVEIYSPPYLFDSNGNRIQDTQRPLITSAPERVSYGETFFVGTSGAGVSPTVSLVRLASVTHGFNQDQRQLFLNRSQVSSSGMSIAAPADSHKCPPGYYMLFVLNAGVPSKAKMIRVLETPAYDGFIDGSDCEKIWGWAWNRVTPNRPINVIIHSGSSYIATIPANLPCQDLLLAEKGDGYHAFTFNVPDSLKNGQVQSIALTWGDQYLPLFPTQLPSGWASGEGATWEQATQFSSTINGKITHIRFYKDSNETGIHIGRIWSDTGVLLAQVQFDYETPSGWQEQALPTPLLITAGVRYRVSYNINSFVAKTFAGLNSPITNLPLTAHTSYFSTPAGTFPTTNSPSILFADVRFSASP